MSKTTLPLVINTRPSERAALLTHHLQSAGLSVIEMPMLALQLRSVTDADIETMQAWLSGAYKALVIVSPTAAASGLAVWQMLKQQIDANNNLQNTTIAISSNLSSAPSHIIAVGAATAEVLRQSDMTNASCEVLQPSIANNEGMLAMPEIESLQPGDKLLVWRGLGGRRLLVNTLQARGVHIDSIAWYERTMPSLASQQYQTWQQQFNSGDDSSIISLKPRVIISSGTAFEHWEKIVSHSQLMSVNSIKSFALKPFSLSDFIYIVLGERLATMMSAKQLDYHQVEDLAPATILSAIESDLY